MATKSALTHGKTYTRREMGGYLIGMFGQNLIYQIVNTGLYFYFQNVIAPKAQMKLWTLLVSAKQTSPELDIPEGVFYSDIDGYNIYVKKKDRAYK